MELVSITICSVKFWRVTAGMPVFCGDRFELTLIRYSIEQTGTHAQDYITQADLITASKHRFKV